MKGKRLTSAALLVGILLLHSVGNVYAHPWFARRLVVNCNTCHDAFPKTNDYGWYFKSTGYQSPPFSYDGLEESPLRRFLRYFPIGARFKVDAINSEPSDVEGNLTFREIQLIGGGTVLDNTISWWLHKHIVAENDVVSLFDGAAHEMWVQQNYRLGKADATRVNLRFGMSELPMRFSPSKTNISEVGYAIYNAALGENNFTLSTPQYGVYLNITRLGGLSYQEVKSNFSLGFVNGVGEVFPNKLTEVFGRMSTAFSKTMIGAFTYVGSNSLALAMDEHGEEGQEEHEHVAELTDNNFYRVGLDLDANVTWSLNIFALALYGRDSNAFGLQQSVSANYYGGFIGADFVPNERLLLSARFDLVRFGDLPEAEEHDEHGEEMVMEEDEHGAEEEEHGSGGHGHHGSLVTSNTDAMVFGLHFLPFPKFQQLRLTAEYRLAFRGQSDLLLAGLQFSL